MNEPPAERLSEDRLLPLSALQHLRFCERQCALIHIEGLWAENRLTGEGAHLLWWCEGDGTSARGSFGFPGWHPTDRCSSQRG